MTDSCFQLPASAAGSSEAVGCYMATPLRALRGPSSDVGLDFFLGVGASLSCFERHFSFTPAKKKPPAGQTCSGNTALPAEQQSCRALRIPGREERAQVCARPRVTGLGKRAPWYRL